MMGTGLIATPIAKVSTALIPCAMAGPFPEGGGSIPQPAALPP
jgi:hypothetical protein